MKKMTVLRTILSLTLTAFLLCGCGNSEAAEPVEEVPEVTEEQVTEEPKREVQQPAEEETAEEEVAESTDETYNGMTVAKPETTVSDINGFLDYAESLEQPALLIYNENEGYVINIGEGEYYQLKKDDRIFEYWSNNGPTESRTDLYLHTLNETSMNKNIFEDVLVDSEKMDSPQEINYVVFFTEKEYDGDYFLLTCYLDAPAE